MRRIYNIILDTLMILAATVASMSLIGDITIEFKHLAANLNWFLFVFVCYIFRFGVRTPKYGNSNNTLLIFFLVLILWEGLQAILLDRSVGYTYIVEYVSYIIFYAYFTNLTQESTDLLPIIKPYCAYYLFSCFIIFLSASLLVTGLLSPTDNPLTEGRLISNNVENLGTFYFWPGHLSIVSLSSRVKLFGDLPILCGLSHEPHVLGNSIFPAFFLMLYFLSNKKWVKVAVFSSLGVILILSFSTTSFLSLSFVLFIEYFLYKTSYGNGGNILITLIILMFVYLLLNNYGILDQFVNLSSDKIAGAGGSNKYSESLLLYSLTPDSILGDGIYPRTQSQESFLNGNIGFVSSILINIFYILFVTKALKLFNSNDKLVHYIGLASIYFFVHSLKLGCLIFNYPLMFYMTYLISYSESRLKNNKLIKI